MKYKISIIVPIYNAKKYLDRTINSVINQTIGFKNLELILIDNGSNDGSKTIINKFCEKYDNILPIYIEKNTGSAAIPRNLGIEKSTADYIMFLDSDDEFMPDFCEMLYKKIIENDVDLVKCNSITKTDTQESYTYYFDESIKEKVIKNTDTPLKIVTIWNGIHKTELLRKNNIIFPNYMGEDVYFTTKEFINMKKMLYLNNYFGYKYYYDENSYAKKPSNENIIGLLNVFKETRDMCKKYGREDVMDVILGRQIIGIFIRINNSSAPIQIKKKFLKDLYSIVKTMPNLIIDSKVFKIANYLMMKKLFYLTIAYLKISPKIYSSKLLLTITKQIKR